MSKWQTWEGFWTHKKTGHKFPLKLLSCDPEHFKKIKRRHPGTEWVPAY